MSLTYLTNAKLFDCQTTFRAPLKMAAGSGLGTRLSQPSQVFNLVPIRPFGIGSKGATAPILFVNKRPITVAH